MVAVRILHLHIDVQAHDGHPRAPGYGGRDEVRRRRNWMEICRGGRDERGELKGWT